MLRPPAGTEAENDSPSSLGSTEGNDWREAFALLDGAYSDETIRCYALDVRDFTGWCMANGLLALPASPTTIARYLDHLSVELRPSTLRRRTAAIRKVHRLSGYPDPTAEEPVVLALRRARRSKPSRPHQALGLTAPFRERLVAACGDDLTGLRDATMLAIGYDTLCRRSELVALRVEDVERRPNGGANILVRRAKNDPEGNGRIAAISSASLSRLEAWLAEAGIEAGPIFRPVYGNVVRTRHLHPLIVSRVIKKAARRAGLEVALVAEFSGHSMRVGAAQDLNQRGVDLLTIMRAGGWRSANVVARYVEKSDLTIWD